jgi:hypothetical protein
LRELIRQKEKTNKPDIKIKIWFFLRIIVVFSLVMFMRMIFAKIYFENYFNNFFIL